MTRREKVPSTLGPAWVVSDEYLCLHAHSSSARYLVPPVTRRGIRVRVYAELVILYWNQDTLAGLMVIVTMATLLQIVARILLCLCICSVIQGIPSHADRKYHGVVADHNGLHHVVELDRATRRPVLEMGKFPLVWGWFDPTICASTG